MIKFKEMTLDELAEILSLTIKFDKENKLITFLAMLSAYTANSQINVSFNAPSSSGKTYLATEIAGLFPSEDKIELSGASPTSFYHGEGVYDEDRKAKVVSLSRKILIFYEQPDPQLQAKLRSVMSHDQWEIKYRITNKGKKGEHRAELIIIQGFPTTIFCSAGLRMDEQEATRAILLSPEVTEDKLREGVHLQVVRSANPSDFADKIQFNKERILLMKRIVAIRDEMIDDIVIPNPQAVEKRFKAMLPTIKPRHMRDIGHLMRLIKTISLLNLWHRWNSTGQLEANDSDVDQAFNLWSYFVESQNLDIPPAVINFYKKYILPAYDEKAKDPDWVASIDKGLVGLSREELGRYHLKIEGRPVNDEQVRKQILPMLENVSLISLRQPIEGDKRSRHIFPQWRPDENNIGKAGSPPDKEAEAIIDTVNKIWPD